VKLPDPNLPRLRLPIGARGVFRLGLLVLGALIAGNLAVITFAWSQHPKTDGSLIAVLWVLSLVGLVLLGWLWKAAPQGSRAPPAPPGRPH